MRQLGPGPAALLPPPEFHDCNGKMGHGPAEFFLRVDGHKEDGLDYEDDMEDVSAEGAGRGDRVFFPFHKRMDENPAWKCYCLEAGLRVGIGVRVGVRG